MPKILIKGAGEKTGIVVVLLAGFFGVVCFVLVFFNNL